MIRSKLALLICAAVMEILGTACNRKTLTEEKALQFAATAMQDILPGLLTTLQEKASKEGVAAAVPFCKDFAPTYGKVKNEQWNARARRELQLSSFSFRRISLKNRNPMNAPDARQGEILAQWEQGKIKPAFYQTEGKFYTLHPIKITQPLCLNCHGDSSTLDKKAAARIKELYPADKATGYKLGDLRGAFVTEMSFTN